MLTGFKEVDDSVKQSKAKQSMAVLATNNEMPVPKMNSNQHTETALINKDLGDRGFIKAQAPGKWTDCKITILLAWFDHLEKCFSYKELLFQKFSQLPSC